MGCAGRHQDERASAALEALVGRRFLRQLFGGGGSDGARVLAAYGLKPSINGRPVDANSVDWNKVDIRQFSFVQPPGRKIRWAK